MKRYLLTTLLICSCVLETVAQKLITVKKDLGDLNQELYHDGSVSIEETLGLTIYFSQKKLNQITITFTLMTEAIDRGDHPGPLQSETKILLRKRGESLNINGTWELQSECVNNKTNENLIRFKLKELGDYELLIYSSTAPYAIAYWEIIAEDLSDEPFPVPESEPVTEFEYQSNLSPSKNYILSKTFRDEAGNTSFDEIQYLDGFKRPIQEIKIKGSGDGNSDIITPINYGIDGRVEKKYLPYVKAGNNGLYVGNPYDSSNFSVYGAREQTSAFTQLTYETNPSGRELEQLGPGIDWHNGMKSIKTNYLTNKLSGDLSCILFSVEGAGMNTKIKKNGYYPESTLSITKLSDEQGNVAYKFVNNANQTILTRQINGSESLDTYYLFDDLGNLSYVLPPLAVDRITDFSDSNSVMQQLAYMYKYDSYNHCIWKRLPGCEPIYCIYDKADRLIFMQDGELRAKNKWTFTIYDLLGRIVLTGVCDNLLNYISDPLKSVVVSGSWIKATNLYKGYSIKGVDLVNPKILSALYYDNYEFLGLNAIPDTINSTATKYEALAGFGTRYPGRSAELLTGTFTAQCLADGSISSGYLYTVMYYDYKDQVIQKRSNNHLPGGTEIEYLAYNFANQPTQRKHVHSATNKTTQTEWYTYTYDHAGRLLTIKHQLNNNSSVILVDNVYDELGRLKSNKRNGQSNLKTEYSYNIRSWMKNISNPLFSQTLYYNDANKSKTNTLIYNGNISAMDWKVSGETKERGYDFAYDGMSQLTQANYLESNTRNNRYNTSYTYDKHGNILTLNRRGNQGTTTDGVIDNLSLSYRGNQLLKVEDSAANPSLSSSMDFRESVHQDIEYFYDANGNQTKDLNKGITNIEYNLLNLPRRITFNGINNPVNEYVYSAAGKKLTVIHKISSEKRTDYVGNMIYENGTLKRILVDGGFIENGTYHFFLQDHLGNNRVVAKADGTVVQTNHYYPYGMSFAESTQTSNQPYKYNGKELDSENGLNLYDYEARQMDGTVGRFTTIDPMNEKHYSISPYSYCQNNPITRIDPSGMLDDWFQKQNGDIWFDPDIKTQADLNNGEIYLWAEYTEDDGTFYRSDGSILFKDETKAYNRMVNHSKLSGNETFSVLTNEGVLMLPEYKNDATTVDLNDYGYKVKNGNIVDSFGKTFKTFGTVHTHPDGSGPSRYTGYSYGDLGFASLTPFEPVYVLRIPKNMVSYIIVNEVNANLATSRNNDYGNITNGNRYTLSKLLQGSWRLKTYTLTH